MTRDVGPPRETVWIFDIEADYRAARILDLAAAETAVERLIGTPGEVAEEVVAEGVERNDLATILGGGAALRRHGRLSGRNLDFFIQAIRLEGRHTEAADLLEAQAAAMPDAPVVHLALAEAAAAAGRFAIGRAAAERSNTLRPKPEAANLARRIKWVGKLHANLAGLGWQDIRKLVEGCLMLDAAETARDVLRFVADHPPQVEPALEDLLRLAMKALRLGEARLARPMVEHLAEVWPDDRDVQKLMVECGGRLGHVAVAAQAADVVRQSPARPQIASVDADAAKARRELRHALAAAYAAAGRPADAVWELDALVIEDSRDLVSLNALRRAVGQYVLGELDLPWAAPRPPKVINLLPYYNERMLLDLRLAEMGGWVDHFVVAEAAEAFTGRAKPLHFGDVRRDYAAFGDRLLHVPVERFPQAMRSAWAREFYQRDVAIRALAGLWRPDDIILITDADEVVDRRALAGRPWPNLASLRMATSKFFFNYVADPSTPHGNRRSGAVCRADLLARFGASYIRSGLSTMRKRWESVPRAGWHFTSITDADGLAAKFTDFSHQDDSKAVLRDTDGAAEILARVRSGAAEPGWAVRPLDGRFPAFVHENRDRLGGLMLPARPGAASGGAG